MPWQSKPEEEEWDRKRNRDRERETERNYRERKMNTNEVTKYMNLTLIKEGTKIKGWMTFVKREKNI